MLIENHGNVDARGNDQWTALMIAAHAGKREVAKMLIENNASIDAGNRDQRTALMFAAHQGHEQIVQMLLENDIRAKMAPSLMQGVAINGRL